MDVRWRDQVLQTVWTSRLLLEPLRVEHAEEMVAVLADDSLYEFTGGSAPTIEQLTARYRRQVAGSDRDDESWLNWIVRRIDTSQAAGFVQATVVGDAADVAWLVATTQQRQGVAREAAGMMLTWLASHGVSRCRAHIAPDHVASARVAEVLGLTRSGDTDDAGEEVWTGTAPFPPPD
ncbi:MAG: GNAT family N-acetyltransferase [Actinomycetota bacterium]